MQQSMPQRQRLSKWQLLKEAEADYLRTGSQEKFVELYKADEDPRKHLGVEYFKCFRESLIQGSSFSLVLLRATIRNLPALLDMIDIDFSMYPVNLMYVRVWNVLVTINSFSRGDEREAVKAALCLRTLLSRNSSALKANLSVITPDFYQWDFVPLSRSEEGGGRGGEAEWVEEVVVWSVETVYQEIVRWYTLEELGKFFRKLWSVTAHFPKARDVIVRMSRIHNYVPPEAEVIARLPRIVADNSKELLCRLGELPLVVIDLLWKRYFCR